MIFSGNRTAPSPPQVTQIPAREELKKKEEEDDDDETTSSSEETESETDEESETETRPSTIAPSATTQERRSESAMARTDIGPLLARSAEARRGSKEDSPSARYIYPNLKSRLKQGFVNSYKYSEVISNIKSSSLICLFT